MDKSITDLPTSTLLTWWANADTQDQYTFPVRAAMNLGYRLTSEQVRREVRKRLKQEQLLPVDRPPTAKDYYRIKIDIITADDGELE